jgi:transcriptional regulator with XRE-family HTH domain
MKNLDRIRKEMSPVRRRKIKARAAEILAEEMTRQQLRRARKLTQVRLAKKLGLTQDGVSRLEKRTDVLLSTLRGYVEALGGKLSLVAEFPDRSPVILSGIAEDESAPKSNGRKRTHAHARGGTGACRA